MSTPDPMPPPPPMPGPHGIPNHLAWAIVSAVLVTITSMLACCCMPIGLAAAIPTVIFATRVNRLLSFDDIAGARTASGKARLWCWISTGLAIFFAIIFGMWISGDSAGWVDDSQWRELMEQVEKQR